MGMVPTYDVRPTASRYSSCSTPNTTIHVFRPENNVGVSSQPMNDTRVLCLKQTKVTLLPKKSTMKIQLRRSHLIQKNKNKKRPSGWRRRDQKGCYSSRLAVVVPSIISSIAISAHSKIYGKVYVFPFRDDVFYLVIRGFTSAYYVRIQSINIRRHIERRHVNREEFRD